MLFKATFMSNFELRKCCQRLRTASPATLLASHARSLSSILSRSRSRSPSLSVSLLLFVYFAAFRFVIILLMASVVVITCLRFRVLETVYSSALRTHVMPADYVAAVASVKSLGRI